MSPFAKIISAVVLAASVGSVAAPAFAALPTSTAETVNGVSTTNPFLGLVLPSTTVGAAMDTAIADLSPTDRGTFGRTCATILQNTGSFSSADVHLCMVHFPVIDTIDLNG